MKKFSPVRQERGLTLIEVIASILLISIILLSFMGMFLQSNKTTATSDDIVDATYLAQKEMESIYKFRAELYTVLEGEMGYVKDEEATREKGADTWVKQVDASHIYVTLKAPDDLGLTPIIIEVQENGKSKSIMENRYKLGG